MELKRLVVKVPEDVMKTIAFMKVITKKSTAEIIEMAINQLHKKKLTKIEWMNLREWFDKTH